MPQIDNEILYNIVQVASGATWIGTQDGNTVQFSFAGFVEALKTEADLLYFGNAQKVGQTVFGNVTGVAISSSPTINGGDTYIGVINTFPPTIDAHIDFILQKKSR
jgi:hypothetical protein